MKNFETEFKWDASAPFSFARMLGAVRKTADKKNISTPTYLKIKDIYLDSPDGKLQREKIALRVRNTQGKCELTYKTRTEVVNGKAVRREETLPLVGIKKLTEALVFLNEKKGWQGICLNNLSVLFTIHNRRVVRLISQGTNEFELSFDTCEIHAGKKRVKLKEIELELKKGSAIEMEKFAAQIMKVSGLPFSKKSKVKTATALLAGGDK